LKGRRPSAQRRTKARRALSTPRAETRQSPGPAAERLQKALARAGLGSRREIEVWIRAGRLTVNGQVATLGRRVTAADRLQLDGRAIRQRPPTSESRVFVCHRSPGEPLQSGGSPAGADDGGTTDPAGHSGVRVASEAAAAGAFLERLPRRAGRRFITVSPMPRVDGGLELVTSDGDRAATLQRAMRQLTVEFSVRVHGVLNEQGLQQIQQGELDDGRTLHIISCTAAGGEGRNRWYALVTRGASGKDVRQVFERQGALVSRVLRTRLGSLLLDRHMARGRFRELTAEELRQLTAAGDPELAAAAGHRTPDP
jgi:23S rRNA pseudouridine2605 synthase